MNPMLLVVAGPLVGFLISSEILVFGQVAGVDHKAGVELGSTFEVDGLSMEIEQEPIEYREGDEITTVRKENGLSKYANVTLRWPSGIDTSNWKLIFEREAALDEIREEYAERLNEEDEESGEMIQIDPPKLIIPAQ